MSSENDLEIARELELQILLGTPAVYIVNRAQAKFVKELRGQEGQLGDLDAVALTLLLIAAGRADELERYRLWPGTAPTSYLPRAKELLLEAAREMQEELYQKGL